MIQYFYLISGKLHLMFNTHHVSEVAHKCNHTCLKIAHWRTKYSEKRELHHSFQCSVLIGNIKKINKTLIVGEIAM